MRSANLWCALFPILYSFLVGQLFNFRNSDRNHAEIEPNGSSGTRKTRESSDGVPNQQGYTQKVDRGGRLD